MSLSAAYGVYTLRQAGAKRPWLRRFSFLLLVVGLGGAVLIMMLALVGEYHRSLHVFCAANLRAGVFPALKAYAAEHGGELPPSWDELLAYLSPDVLVCPASKDTPVRREATTATQQLLAFQQGGHVSYIYSGMGLKWDQTTSQTVLAYDSAPRHGNRVAVLYGDGNVDMRTLSDLESMMNAQRLRASSHPVGRQ